MKKFLVILSALVCIWGLSVSSMAAVSCSPSDFGSAFTKKDGYYAVSPVVQASKFTSAQLAVWQEWAAVFSGDDPTRIALGFVGMSGSTPYFQLFLVDSDYTYKNTSTGHPGICSSSGSGYRGLVIRGDGNVSSSNIGYFASSSSPYQVDGGYWCFCGYSKLDNIPDSFHFVDFGTGVEITDDLGTLEPDPPSSSSTGWIPPVVSDPVIPEGDEYVFYDTKILGLFLNHVRTQIVHAANVGWLIFGFILVWHVIKRVIKAFSSR